MIKLCAFSDEASASLDGQIKALKRNGINYTELRSVDGVNVASITEESAKKIKKELEKIYFRILGEKKKFKFRKIFAKLTNKKDYKSYILENVEEILSKFNFSNRRIFKKIKKKIFYPQFLRIIAAKMSQKSNEKLFIYNI